MPPEPYRTLRSLVHYDYTLSMAVTRTKNQLKALCRRHAIPCQGTGVYCKAGRKEFLSGMPNGFVRWPEVRFLQRAGRS